MPVKKMGVPPALGSAREGLAEKLASELRANRESGQPTVYEHEYSTKRVRVVVIWDEWADASLEERTAVILKAYDLARGTPGRDKIALASGLTVPEAAGTGMLPFQVLPARRATDAVTQQELEAAMLQQGASKLSRGDGLLLRFATREEAEACVARLARQLPASEHVWLITREMQARDVSFRDSAEAEAG